MATGNRCGAVNNHGRNQPNRCRKDEACQFRLYYIYHIIYNRFLKLKLKLWFGLVFIVWPIARTIACQKKDGLVLDLSNTAGGGSTCTDPIAFFTALHIVSREKGFWRKSNIRTFSALDATELVLSHEIRMIGAALPFDRIRSAISNPEPSGNFQSST